MKNRFLIVMAAIASILLALGALVFWKAPEPTYLNEPLSFWVNRLGSEPKAYDQFRAALTAIGPKAIPLLFRQIRRENSTWGRFYRWIWPRLPHVLQAKTRRPEPIDIGRIPGLGMAIGRMGPDALPGVLPALRDRNGDVRWAAIAAFVEISPKPAEATPALARLLKDKNAHVRQQAATALGAMGTNAAQAIPELICALSDSEIGPSNTVFRTARYSITATGPSIVSVRARAANALGKLGRQAHAAVPELNRLLSDAWQQTRVEAAIALWQICRATNVVPALIGELRLADRPYSCERILGQLNEIGAEAKAAGATIARLCQSDCWPDSNSTSHSFKVSPEIRRIACDVLAKLDPVTAAAIGHQSK